MTARAQQWLPELGLGLLAVFFVYRELGTFPGSWLDEGLFIMTAKNFAAGKGYGIPLLDQIWFYPYFLAIGPTVIGPVALSIKLFGLSVAAARLPMTLYILATCVTLYAFTKHITGRFTARWALLLLITLSAFINTGKPVLGEVPAFFYLLLGLLCWERMGRPTMRGILSGIAVGLAIVTKITFVIALPAIALVFLFSVVRRRWKDAWSAALCGIIAAAVYLPWRLLELSHTPAGGLGEEIQKFVFGGGEIPMLYVLRENWQVLIRLPFLTFCIVALLGFTGLWSARPQMRQSTKILVTATVALFTLYYLNSYGWYRHLLPAHLLLIPFVPAGMMVLLVERRMAMLGLAAFAALQGTWQLTHFGSGYGTALAETVRVVKEEYAETDLLIEQAEVFAQLPENPHWFFLVRDRVSPSMPEMFMNPTGKLRCFKRLRKLNDEELETYGGAAVRVGNAHVIPPLANCR